MYKGFIFCVLSHVVVMTFPTHSFAFGQEIHPKNSTIAQADSPTADKKTATSTASGKSIYNKTCVACHGVDGRGVAPSYLDFTQKGGVLSQPYNVLLQNIIRGIGSMPPKGGYPALTDKDMEAALDYIMSHFAPEPIPESTGNEAQDIQLMKQQIMELNKKLERLEAAQLNRQNKTVEPITKNNEPKTNQPIIPKTNAPSSNGEVVYKQNCAACHGANGKGVAPSFPDLTKKGGALAQSSDVLLHHIIYGIGSMPPKGGNPSLSDADLKASLDYIKTAFAPEQKSQTIQSTTPIQQQTNKTNQNTESSSQGKKPLEQKPVEKSEQQSNKGVSTENKESNVTSTSYFWPNPDFSALLTGSASAGYSVPNNRSGSFDIITFNPMVLARYKDLLLLHSDLDFSLDDDGNTTVELGNLNLNLFLNEVAVFGIGKLDSPLGYFVQNLSPSWVNKLPTAPTGFDSDEAAPQTQLGAQLRGGFYLLSRLKMNYIAFVANGPRAFADPMTGLIDFISTDSYPNNYGTFIGGGRVGILPIPNLEIGFSGAGGNVALFDVNTNLTFGERGRDYTSLGADLSFQWKSWDFRAEVIQQQIGAQNLSLFPQSAGWKAWYLQAAYMIPATKLQPIVRWGGYTSPVSSQSQHQVALGLDYWLAPSIALQAAYEFNNGQHGTDSDSNLFLIQLVCGF